MFSMLRSGAMLLLLVIGTVGCAINDKGLVTVESYECETAMALHLRAWGIFVSTSPVDRGLTIGFARKAYIFPKQDNIHGFPENYKFQFLDMWKKERLGLKKANHPGSLSDLGMPIAVVSTQIGVALDFSSQRTGVMVGFKLENAIRIPSDHEGVLFLSTDFIDLRKTQVFLRESILEREEF